MERRLNKKLETYITTFKDSIREKATQLGLSSDSKDTQLLQFIYDYDRLSFTKEDFQKRKRVKNFVPIYDRCCATRASDEQCTRRRKEGSEFCGTHMKGTPHGIVVENPNEPKVKIPGPPSGPCPRYQSRNSLGYRAWFARIRSTRRGRRGHLPDWSGKH